MTTNQKGDITELKLQLFLIQKGLKLSKPIGSYRYDFILDYRGKLLRIQSKTSHINKRDRYKNSISFKTCSQNSSKTRTPYTKKDCDYIATIWKEEPYFIPVSDINKTEMILRIKPAKNNQQKGIKLLSTYSYKNFIKRIK